MNLADSRDAVSEAQTYIMGYHGWGGHCNGLRLLIRGHGLQRHQPTDRMYLESAPDTLIRAV